MCSSVMPVMADSDASKSNGSAVVDHEGSSSNAEKGNIAANSKSSGDGGSSSSSSSSGGSSGTSNKPEEMRLMALSDNYLTQQESMSMCIAANRGLYHSGYRCYALESQSYNESVSQLHDGKVECIFLPANLQKFLISSNDDGDSNGAVGGAANVADGVGTTGMGGKSSISYDRFRFVLSLQNEFLLLIVRADSKIDSLDQIKGKKIGIGHGNSPTRLALDMIRKAKKWYSSGYLSNVVAMDVDDQVTALCSGEIDVMSVMSAQPNPAVQEVSKRCHVKIIDINDTDVQEYLRSDKSYVQSQLDSGIYLGNPFPVNTIASTMMLVSSADVSDSVIYQFVQQVMSNLDVLRNLHPSLKHITKQSIVKNVDGGIHMHSGVRRYLRDMRENTKIAIAADTANAKSAT